MSNARELSEIASAIVIDGSKNVGIGTSSPTTKLTIGSIAAGTIEATYKGNIRIEGTETTLESQGGLEFKMTSDGYGAKIQTLSSSGTNLVFATRNASATWSERMRINPAGNVQIGTTIARSFLTVAAPDATGNGINITNTNAVNNTTKYATLDYAGTDTASSYKPTGYVRVSPADANYIGSYMAFATRGSDVVAERMRIDSSGNVGIGGAAGSGYRLDVVDAQSNLRIRSSSATSTNQPKLHFWHEGNDIFTLQGGADLRFLAGNITERMRIDSSGNLLVGTTSAFGIGPLQVQAGTSKQLSLRHSSAAAGKYWSIGPDNAASNIVILNQSGQGVYMVDGANAWTGASDERLKTDLLPITDAANKVSTLRAVTGRFKTDEEGTSRAFLIAQDVQKVLPEAVNARDDELGTLGIQYTDVIPLLVAAIKEQQVMIEELKAKVAALEAA